MTTSAHQEPAACPTLEEITAAGHGLNLDFIDYPTAWAIARSGIEHVHPDCSFVQSGGFLLCDCDALPLRWAELKTAFDGKDGLTLAEPYLNHQRAAVKTPGETPIASDVEARPTR